jgi:predicted alpha/beta hydrolase family esterase
MLHTLFSEFQLILVPGLHDSCPGHWQSRWERLHGLDRVRQDDWDHPVLADWSARVGALRDADPRPALLIAHSFGCLAAVHNMARQPRKLAGALLVAPADPDKFNVALDLPATALPCPSIVIASTNDPWMRFKDAAAWAGHWGSELVDAGALGHINGDSGLGDWPEGWVQLRRLLDPHHDETTKLRYVYGPQSHTLTKGAAQ